MVQDIRFGRDGWRDQVVDRYMFANAHCCAQGFASYMQDLGNWGEWIVVGHDKRFLGENFSAAVSEVLAGNEFNGDHLQGSGTQTVGDK